MNHCFGNIVRSKTICETIKPSVFPPSLFCKRMYTLYLPICLESFRYYNFDIKGNILLIHYWIMIFRSVHVAMRRCGVDNWNFSYPTGGDKFVCCQVNVDDGPIDFSSFYRSNNVMTSFAATFWLVWLHRWISLSCCCNVQSTILKPVVPFDDEEDSTTLVKSYISSSKLLSVR